MFLKTVAIVCRHIATTVCCLGQTFSGVTDYVHDDGYEDGHQTIRMRTMQDPISIVDVVFLKTNFFISQLMLPFNTSGVCINNEIQTANCLAWPTHISSK